MLKVFVGTRYFIYSDEVWIVAETEAVAEKKLQDLEVSEVCGGVVVMVSTWMMHG